MFKKILIANRGEIALRVIRACREMGIITVAVFSEADRNGLHVLLADEAYFIGPPQSNESYLKMDKIIEVAKKAKVDAIHPGYGFLSENAQFARKLKDAGITFIGPTPKNIELMGDKLSAKDLMAKAGVPIVPGSLGAVPDLEEAQKVCEEIGFPIIIKASSGGGGKGMRIVNKKEELSSAFRACCSEGLSYFGNSEVYIEKYISSPKHIEIQVFGDTHGNMVHLFDRECSVQRRHQKIIEEAPSPSVPEEVRQTMGEIAVKAAKSIQYIGAGTFEFIYDGHTHDFYFMEMNTRLQVEHPVTEMVTSKDLVKEQIKVASGNPLSFKQEELRIKGHAIEARICAEDPVSYTPSPGTIRVCRMPQGPFVRLDSHAYPGYEVPLYYDPMIAKVIVLGKDRIDAIEKMQRALTEFILTGVKSNIVLHKSVLDHPKFLDGSYTTKFIETELEISEPDLFKFVDDDVFLITAAISAFNDRKQKSVKTNFETSQWKSHGRKKSMRP